MKHSIPLILGIILNIFKTNSQCDGIQSGSTSIADFDVQISLDCATEKVELSIEYKAYTDNWFGIVFHHTMLSHPSLIYTTGKAQDRSAALYAYDMTAKTVSGVRYDSSNDWTEVNTIIDGEYLHITYEQDLSNTEWDTSTNEVGFRFAIGSSLQLELHESKTAHATLFLSSDSDASNATPNPTTVATSTPSPIATPSTTNDDDGCGGFEYRTASDSFDDFDVTVTINCVDETITIDITYNDFNNNWFGVVFNDEMQGDALIYTSGKSNDRDEGVYFYSISEGKSSGSVVYTEFFNWREIETTVVNDGVIRVVYEQDLANTKWNVDTTDIPMRWAFGPESAALTLVQHQERSSSTKHFDLNTGGSRNQADDLTKQYVHGALMWSAWTVFASIGIMGSAFRWILPNKPNGLWFQIHRFAQSMVVILHVGGFIIAVIFTQDSGVKHFSNNHMIIGLVVTVLVVLQPLNALFRPHPVGSDQKKPLLRLIWEIIHKLSGYSAWILAAVTAYLGFNLAMIDKGFLGYIHLIVILMIVVFYVVLSIVGCLREKQMHEVETVNDSERDDDNNANDDDADDEDDDMEDPQESDQFVGGRN